MSSAAEAIDTKAASAQTQISTPHIEDGKDSQVRQRTLPQGASAVKPSVSSEPVQGSTASSTGAQSSAAPPGQSPDPQRSSSRSSRKPAASANHLLGFQYQPAPTAGRGRGGAGGGGGHHSNQGSGHRSGSGRGTHHHQHSHSKRHHASKPQKYDRNKFLQANYRFLVSDGVDATQYHEDADRMFDWQDVLQVELLTSTPVKCPISLDCPPVCPQITPCGHIYSFPAIMQHLVHHGGDQLKRFAPCPLCFEPVVARDLRLVLITPVTQPKVGQSITFQLLQRGKTTIIPQPAGQASALPGPDSAATDNQMSVDQGATSSRAALPGRKGAAGPVTLASAEAAAVAAAQELREQGVVAVGAGAGDPTHPLAVNRFAKFAVVGPQGATGLWRDAARDLAGYAAEVMAEGSLDAAQTAPFVYMSLEQLAARARRWVTHRAELLVERAHLVAPGGGGRRAGGVPGAQGVAPAPGVQGSGQDPLDPEAQGAEAEEAVKKMFMAAAQSVADEAIRAEQQSKVEQQFPRLGPGPAPAAARHASAANTAWSAAGVKNVPGGTGTSSAAGSSQSQSSKGKGDSGVTTSPSVPAVSLGSISQAAGGPAGRRPPSVSTSQSARGASQVASNPGPAEDPEDDSLTFAFEGDTSPHAAESGSSETHTGRAGSPGARGQGQVEGGRDALGAGAELSSSVGAGAGDAILGTSPGSLAVVNSVNRSGDHYMYQAVDGQWVFLDPLCIRCLLAHYGSHDACPATLTAPILELDRVEQTDTTRKRWKFLSHLPLTGTFTLAEVSLAHLLPRSALAPFADEITARERRRQRRAAEERRAAAAEAAAARLARAARRGPSASELAAMPALGSNSSDAAAAALAAGRPVACLADAEALAAARALGFSSAEELASHVAAQAALDAATGAPPSSSPSMSSGVSFAKMTKLGFAASGPALGCSPPTSVAALTAPQGAWAGKGSKGSQAASSTAGAVGSSSSSGSRSGWGPASRSADSQVQASGAAEGPQTPGSGKKANKKGVLLFTSGAARRY